MRYNVAINGKKYIVEVERAAGIYKQISRHPLGTLAAGPAEATVVSEAPKAAAASAPAPTAPAPASVPAPAPAAKVPAQSASAGTVEVPSPMPGSVFDIRAKVGDQVAAGQAIIVLEAMKMEIEVVAPSAGTIDAILVNKGDAVETGTVLAAIK